MGRSSARGAMALLLPLAASCTSITTLHTARPLPVGETEVVFAPGVYVFDDTDPGDETAWLPFFEGGVRHGFGERVDAGLRTTAFATFSADVNFALVKTERFALSVDPTVSVFGLLVPDLWISTLWLQVLADVYTSDDLTVTVGVKPGYASVDLDDDDGDFGFRESTEMLGFGLGARWRASDSLALLPELNVIFLQDDELDDEVIWTFAVGFAF